MKYEKSCGAVLFTRKGGEVKYLLVRQLKGFYGFPKGHVEPGESEKETALREIFEEVGIKPRLITGFRTEDEHKIPEKPGVMKRVVYFLAEYDGRKPKIQEEELLAAPLVSLERALELFEYESPKRIIKEAQAFIDKFYASGDINDDK